MDSNHPAWRLVIVAMLTLLLVNCIVAVSDKRRCTLDDYRAGSPKEGYICGNLIPRTLSLMCGGTFHSPTKRGLAHSSHHLPGVYQDLDPIEWDNEVSSQVNEGQQQDAGNNGVFMSKMGALSYLRARRSTNNYRTGVYCECCVHRCTYKEMVTYCGPGPQKRHQQLQSLLDTKQEKKKMTMTD